MPSCDSLPSSYYAEPVVIYVHGYVPFIAAPYVCFHVISLLEI